MTSELPNGVDPELWAVATDGEKVMLLALRHLNRAERVEDPLKHLRAIHAEALVTFLPTVTVEEAESLAEQAIVERNAGGIDICADVIERWLAERRDRTGEA